MSEPFIHLHVHSEYSLLDGAIRCTELVETASSMGMNAVALTDHGVMYGCEEFFEKSEKAGIKPIFGCEVYVDPSGIDNREGKGKNHHLVLWAENETGYRNLVKLVSLANTEGFYYKPRIDHHLLARHAEGLIGSSACLAGEIPSLILSGDYEAARDRAFLYRDILGEGRFYLEVMHNALREQALANRELVRLARSEDFPLVATNDAHYLRRSDASWHDVLLCVQTQSTVQTTDRYRFGADDFYFRSPEEMWSLFGAELPDALRNTQEIADRCNVKLTLGKYLLPEFPIPEGQTLETFLEKRAWEGLARRLGTQEIPEAYGERLRYELGVIRQMGFPGYFCIVADIITAAKGQGIPVGPGRGSAAGSLVAWALGITELDPLRYHLLFERFLNPERISMPDIDTDISDKRRDEVLAYIVQKYGADRVSQIITFDRMKSKAAIRDVGRALAMPYSDVDRVAKLVPEGVKTLGEALEKAPDLKQLSDQDLQVRQLIETASHIEGIARHCSQHAAGVVITPVPLVEMVPVRRIGENQVVTQYSMEPIEHLGLVKMDFLGLRTLSVLEDTLSNIVANHKPPLDLSAIPMDDPETFDMLQRADTLGVFQLESSGMQDLLRRLRPDCFEDLIAVLALYRPGPLGSGMVEDYIERKHGRAVTQYPHPCLEKALKETYGVILYQEQVMQCAAELAGYSLGEADLLRRAMGKKKADVMEKQRSKFVDGARERGVDPVKAEEIFDSIEKFAEYGFNKSHSAAYALISYQTAYLKAHYGAEFLAAYLSSMVGARMDILGRYIRGVRDLGFPVLPPDVNESKAAFAAVGKVIRFGLSGVGKVGEAAVDSILKARSEGGPFASFWDFLIRVDLRAVNRGVVENLIKAGAFDALWPNRRQLLENLPTLLEMGQKRAERGNQTSLFLEEQEADDVPPMEPCEDFEVRQKLDFEKEALGLYISGHPFEQIEGRVRPYTTCSLAEVEHWQSRDTPPVVGGLLVGVKERYTKRGDPMGILEFEDTETKLETVCFPKLWQKVKPLLQVGKAYTFSGNVKNDGRLSLLLEEIQPSEEWGRERSPWVRVEITQVDGEEGFFRALARELKGHAGSAPLLVHVEDQGSRVVLHPRSLKVCDTPALRSRLEELFPGRVRVGA
ncbi:DNA polymerase III, alpha subunit [Aminomonas paucivorans DSM 12260]|uniref:DNA-directed DNA polymerase n=1 Tax=Aminomonas paucivorans DSM 12260 TaxID=584708 RepID=E3CYR5_9BACT|nr:DNA polymerase III subunit alpha [Aminomonas paucivorans]EFQ23693.1 DNA polymerase III, alpha subunit [Aminomonas paucivorans DSM 12260]